MKAAFRKIPSGKVPVPKATTPGLAHVFKRVANKYPRVGQQANAPDPTVARLPRPDMAALNQRRGKAQIRQPLIGSPNPADDFE